MELRACSCKFQLFCLLGRFSWVSVPATELFSQAGLGLQSLGFRGVSHGEEFQPEDSETLFIFKWDTILYLYSIYHNYILEQSVAQSSGKWHFQPWPGNPFAAVTQRRLRVTHWGQWSPVELSLGHWGQSTPSLCRAQATPGFIFTRIGNYFRGLKFPPWGWGGT